jgi:hypothetical protein
MQPDPILDIAAIQQWGESSGIASLMHLHWSWPIAEMLHFTGICLLFGSVGLFDLRMIGLVGGISLGALRRLIPFGVAGFALCAVTGFAFVVTAPDQYFYNPAWQTKMGLLLAAGLNMALFYLTAARRAHAQAADATPPAAARIFAMVSLALWLGVVTCGRVITAFRPPFHWCFWCGG